MARSLRPRQRQGELLLSQGGAATIQEVLQLRRDDDAIMAFPECRHIAPWFEDILGIDEISAFRMGTDVVLTPGEALAG